MISSFTCILKKSLGDGTCSVVALEAGLPHPKLTSNPCNISPQSALTQKAAELSARQ